MKVAGSLSSCGIIYSKNLRVFTIVWHNIIKIRNNVMWGLTILYGIFSTFSLHVRNNIWNIGCPT